MQTNLKYRQRPQVPRKSESLSIHEAHQITRSEYAYYDLIICMDQHNIRNLRYTIGEDTQHKVIRLLDLTDNPHDVADPWYTGDFETTYRDILEGCKALLENY